MDLRGIIVNIILSFEGSFTYKDLISRLKEKVDMEDKKNYSEAMSIIKEIFEECSIKVLPCGSELTRYYRENKF